MRVMYVASEATPFIKSGGLADVIGSLPKETAKKDACRMEHVISDESFERIKLISR